MLEHPRDTYFVKNQFNFPASKVGKQLFQYITSKKYLGLNNDQYRITFAYDKIPEKLPSGKDKNITMRMAKPSIEKMKEKAIEYQPDLIVPMGNLALSAITGTKGISKKRGIPQEVTLEVNDLNFKTWVIPTYTIENTLARNETKPFLISDFQLIKSYTKEGAYAFSKGLGEYSLITDFNKVQEIFNMLKSKGQDYKHPIAMDFETNSTNGSLQNVPNKLSKHAREMYGDLVDQEDYVSAKPIILSLTWEEGQGVAIPVEHKKAPWTKEQVDYIEQEIRNLFEDDRWIVGHNFKFDMRFCMDTIGVTKAVHCMDTLLMFYVSVSEESSIEKGLKPLAFRYTTMGGYDQSLVNEKKKILDESEQLARDWYSAHDEKFTKSKYEKICNEVLGASVDGGNFNYEWIPLDVMYPYAGGDTDACLRIFNQLLPPIIENKKWLNLITNFYPKLDEALSLMEHNGLKMNVDRAKELYTIYDKELTKLLDDMRENTPEIQELEDTRRGYLKERVQLMAIKPKDRTEEQKARIKELNKYKGTRADPESKVRYNPSSRNDSKYILYDMMGYRLPIEREYLTDTALKRFGRDINPDEVTTDDFKANAEALEYIVDTYHSEFAKRLIYYTKLQTLMNNFIVKLPTLLDPKHYMHTTFKPAGTVTSRLASKDPRHKLGSLNSLN